MELNLHFPVRLYSLNWEKFTFTFISLFDKEITYLLLLQSALQPLWVLACSNIVEYSQQEGFYRVPLPAARQTPQIGGPVIRTFQLSPQGVLSVRNDASKPQQRKVENYGREIGDNFVESDDFHVTFGFFYMP